MMLRFDTGKKPTQYVSFRRWYSNFMLCRLKAVKVALLELAQLLNL
jgi:hypothetical protein